MSTEQRSWSERLSQNYACADCGGSVYITSAGPIAKGSVAAYKCIRCTSTGGVKDKLTYSEPKLSNLVKK